MSVLIINGSPKGKNGNTEVFINQFVQEMKIPCKISYAAKEDSLYLAEYMRGFDSVIFAMPLYVHAMPGIVMKIIQQLQPAGKAGQSIGFIVQSGFVESAQSEYLERYLSALTKRLNYTYLGTVRRGGSAGVYMMPEQMNKKLFKQLHTLGDYFDQSGSFDMETISEMAQPHKLSKGKSKFMQLLGVLGLGDTMFWNMMLKKNKAFDRRFDKPFASKLTS